MDPWFNQQTAGTVGAILGGVIGGGIGGGLGGTTWLLIQKGWKKLTYSLYSVAILIGLILLGTGLTALFIGQPYHVWYPFVLSGALTSFLMIIFFVMVRKFFAQRERQIMAIEDL